MNSPPSSATAHGAFLVGLTARVVAVSASVLPEGSNLVLDGLTDNRKGAPDDRGAWARELRMRVRSTLRALGIEPDFLVRFDPLPPSSARLDLAVLAACLGALGRLGPDVLGSTLFLGELSLDGLRVRPIRGVLPMLRTANENQSPPRRWPDGGEGWRAVVPKHNEHEARRAGPEFLFAVDRPEELTAPDTSTVCAANWSRARPWRAAEPVDEVVGVGLSARTLRALELAAAGGHGVLLIGEEKERLAAARALHAFLATMTEIEAVATSEIHSVAGLVDLSRIGGLLRERPFRAPHHALSSANELSRRGCGDALVGGGDPVRPGEVSLAHEGLLFLDPAPEFHPTALERIAHALASGEVRIVRDDVRATYPARPALLVLGAAPCKCETNRKFSGRFDETTAHAKWCASEDVVAYHGRATKYLAPFVDMRIEIERDETSSGVRVADVRRRIETTRGRMAKQASAMRGPDPRTRLERAARMAADLVSSERKVTNES